MELVASVVLVEICSFGGFTSIEIRISNKNSKRELSISPDKCNIENIEKKSKN